MAIRLIAIDMDDTLLNDQRVLGVRTRDAVRRCRRRGVYIVPATGRVPAAVGAALAPLHLTEPEDYVVCTNGVTVFHPASGESTHLGVLGPAVVDEAVRVAAASDLSIHTYVGDLIVTTRENSYVESDRVVTGLRVQTSPTLEVDGTPIPKLVLAGNVDALRAAQRRILETFGDGVATTFSRPYFLEVLPPGVNKRVGVDWVARALGVPWSAIAAIGDADNDREMIRAAAVGVAVANANERVKDEADFVTTASNDQDGVAEAIDRILT